MNEYGEFSDEYRDPRFSVGSIVVVSAILSVPIWYYIFQFVSWVLGF